MNLKTRITSTSLVLAIVPLLLACFIVGYYSYQSGSRALEIELEKSLVTLRDIKKDEVESYVNYISDQVLTHAKSKSIIDATQEFKVGFNAYLSEMTPDLEALDALKRYYRIDFSTTYSKKNKDRSPAVDALVNAMSETGKALQSRYIGRNPHPLGGKDQLAFYEDGSHYSMSHKTYHPEIRYYLQTFGYYDIFIVDVENGNVLYSVFKELDFATSLESGPYKNSGLAEAYRKAKDLGGQQKAVFTQFEPYFPSYEGVAAFVATPIVHEGLVTAILIYQMPVDKINMMMTFSNKWKSAGLGDTGETYLTDRKQFVLNNSRGYVEQPQAFVDNLKALGQPAEMLGNIIAKETTIGQLNVNSGAVQAALQGKSGYLIEKGYRGTMVAAAYAPIDVANLGWVIVSELDEAEAFASIYALKKTIVSSVISFASVSFIVAAFAGWVLSGKVIGPVIAVSDSVQHIGNSKDLTIEVPVKGDTEMRALASSVNGLVGSLRQNFQAVMKVVEDLSQSSTEMTSMIDEMNVNTSKQEMDCTLVATAATELQSTAAEVASNTAFTAQETKTAIESMDTMRATVKEASQTTNELAMEVENGRAVLQRVAQESENIGAVLDVISGIAEQTNLLALNAAIEAARAGEQGRGFAVVADEVRHLAKRTQTATTEIEQIIRSLQQSSQDAVKAMEKGSVMAAASVKTSDGISSSLDLVSTIVTKISDMNLQIATAAEEQSCVVSDVSENVNGISLAASNNTQKSALIKTAAGDLNRLALSLHSIVEKYSV